MHSACVYENTCPMWRLPDTVGGGVSTENTGFLDAGSNACARSFSHSACAAASTAFASYPCERGRGGSLEGRAASATARRDYAPARQREGEGSDPPPLRSRTQ